MNTSTLSSRRFFIVVAFLAAGVAGALLRGLSAPKSTVYDVGTLLMVMWIPIVGNIIAFVVKKLVPFVSPPLPAFSSAMPFVSHALVSLALNAEKQSSLAASEPDGRIHAIFVMGTEGFTVRLSVLETRRTDQGLEAEVQFLLPAAALAKFPVGSTFEFMQDERVIGTGQVLSWAESESE